MTSATDLERPRCFGGDDPLMIEYHDREWGRPVRDGRELFEHLTLDIFQAGLSWRVVLHKRQAMRRAFDDFDLVRIAEYGQSDVDRLLADEGIIRNRSKIRATINNAQAWLTFGSSGQDFSDFLWSFTGGQVIRRPRVEEWSQLPTQSERSAAMAAGLKENGFKFVGPTICYAFMQAVGMVDDHLAACFKAQQPGGR
ncbi:MAG: DNA-3-methyladenine glycosylase I [Anaerolineales bacterium]